MQIELRELSQNDGNDILEMLREIGPGENGFGNAEYNMSITEFKDYLYQNINISKGIELEPDWVPQTKYWLIVDGHPVGFGKQRLYLNDNLRINGGHIGYCIRPTARGKGFGNILLRELLKKAKEKNIPKVLITCDDINIASRRVIEYNGGKLERVENGECYYWIILEEGRGIREIHIDDYREIYALWSRTPGMGLSDADSEQSIKKFLIRNSGLSFCYTEENKIIGTILCGHDGRRGYIYHVTVAEEYRGKGIGRTLVEKSLQSLTEAGINKCHLFVFADNETGINFWNSTGWIKRDDIFVYSKNT
jgi:predicted acetyltransferase